MEIAFDGDLVHIRDSKDRSGPMLTFARESFGEFIDFVKTDGAKPE